MTAKTVKAATNSQVRSVSPWGKPAEWPWWLIAAIGLVFYLVYLVLTDAETRSSFWYMLGQKPDALLLGQLAFKGIVITLVIAICGYLVAMSFGLLLGLMRTSSNPILNNVASFYVEIIRGVPMLVLLLYVAFVIAPPITPFFASIANIFVNLGNLLLYNTGIISEPFKAVTAIANHWRAIIALGLGYAAFEAEVFRAGIQSIERGPIRSRQSIGAELFSNDAPYHSAASDSSRFASTGQRFYLDGQRFFVGFGARCAGYDAARQAGCQRQLSLYADADIACLCLFDNCGIADSPAAGDGTPLAERLCPLAQSNNFQTTKVLLCGKR